MFFEAEVGLSLLLWAVQGASTPLIASDRLSQRLQLFLCSDFMYLMCCICRGQNSVDLEAVYFDCFAILCVFARDFPLW
jgi:hypothetical protein